jgi:hypothetical protein
MRAVHLLRLGLVLLVCAAVGCASNNKGKIEGTMWESESGVVKGQTMPAGALFLSFRKDGGLVYRVGTQSYTGKYSLGFGDFVSLHLDKALPNGQDHTETVVIKGNRLTMTDMDGTSLTFRRFGQ